MIQFENVIKRYQMGDTVFEALRGVSFNIDQGEAVAIVGPSGSGKSTTMHIIGLLDKPTEGRYILHGKDVSSLSSDRLAELRNKEIGFVFQSFFLLPKYDALHNVALPLSYRGIAKKEREERAMTCLARVGMDKFHHHKPTELSGGQQQRVAIARALVGEPSLILADEPTGALDTKTSQEVMQLLFDLNKNENRTVVMITHDTDIAHQFPRNIQIRDGKIMDKPLIMEEP
ncbi:MAG: ABC transporter ATP-binding protein [Coxiellaceae bacterium]|nr:ABC transporter ATP-binding protein [Coxiellaceae bacterium]